MEKQTTAQVAKTLGLTKSQLHRVLYLYPGLRPSEHSGRLNSLLWSEAEVAALRTHLVAHPVRRRAQR